MCECIYLIDLHRLQDSDNVPSASMALFRASEQLLARSASKAAPWLQTGMQLLRREFSAQAEPAEDEQSGMWLAVTGPVSSNAAAVDPGHLPHICL
jgi:hypothetical protein